MNALVRKETSVQSRRGSELQVRPGNASDGLIDGLIDAAEYTKFEYEVQPDCMRRQRILL